MNVTLITNIGLDTLKAYLNEAIEVSRFTADIYHPKAGMLSIGKVRLRETKSYCGNHPKACEFKGHDHKHKKAKFLEGADWVEFNDILNDVCDFHRVSCRIESSVCRVRMNEKRRHNYTSNSKAGDGTWIWDKIGEDKDYKDARGMESEPSTFPVGTPGIHTKLHYDCVG